VRDSSAFDRRVSDSIDAIDRFVSRIRANLVDRRSNVRRSVSFRSSSIVSLRRSRPIDRVAVSTSFRARGCRRKIALRVDRSIEFSVRDFRFESVLSSFSFVVLADDRSVSGFDRRSSTIRQKFVGVATSSFDLDSIVSRFVVDGRSSSATSSLRRIDLPRSIERPPIVGRRATSIDLSSNVARSFEKLAIRCRSTRWSCEIDAVSIESSDVDVVDSFSSFVRFRRRSLRCGVSRRSRFRSSCALAIVRLSSAFLANREFVVDDSAFPDRTTDVVRFRSFVFVRGFASSIASISRGRRFVVRASSSIASSLSAMRRVATIDRRRSSLVPSIRHTIVRSRISIRTVDARDADRSIVDDSRDPESRNGRAALARSFASRAVERGVRRSSFDACDFDSSSVRNAFGDDRSSSVSFADSQLRVRRSSRRRRRRAVGFASSSFGRRSPRRSAISRRDDAIEVRLLTLRSTLVASSDGFASVRDDRSIDSTISIDRDRSSSRVASFRPSRRLVRRASSFRNFDRRFVVDRRDRRDVVSSIRFDFDGRSSVEFRRFRRPTFVAGSIGESIGARRSSSVARDRDVSSSRVRFRDFRIDRVRRRFEIFEFVVGRIARSIVRRRRSDRIRVRERARSRRDAISISSTSAIRRRSIVGDLVREPIRSTWFGRFSIRSRHVDDVVDSPIVATIGVGVDVEIRRRDDSFDSRRSSIALASIRRNRSNFGRLSNRFDSSSSIPRVDFDLAFRRFDRSSDRIVRVDFDVESRHSRRVGRRRASSRRPSRDSVDSSSISSADRVEAVDAVRVVSHERRVSVVADFLVDRSSTRNRRSTYSLVRRVVSESFIRSTIRFRIESASRLVVSRRGGDVRSFVRIFARFDRSSFDVRPASSRESSVSIAMRSRFRSFPTSSSIRRSIADRSILFDRARSPSCDSRVASIARIAIRVVRVEIASSSSNRSRATSGSRPSGVSTRPRRLVDVVVGRSSTRVVGSGRRSSSSRSRSRPSSAARLPFRSIRFVSARGRRSGSVARRRRVVGRRVVSSRFVRRCPIAPRARIPRRVRRGAFAAIVRFVASRPLRARSVASAFRRSNRVRSSSRRFRANRVVAFSSVDRVSVGSSSYRVDECRSFVGFESREFRFGARFIGRRRRDVVSRRSPRVCRSRVRVASSDLSRVVAFARVGFRCRGSTARVTSSIARSSAAERRSSWFGVRGSTFGSSRRAFASSSRRVALRRSRRMIFASRRGI